MYVICVLLRTIPRVSNEFAPLHDLSPRPNAYIRGSSIIRNGGNGDRGW
jgi:hypothetical protein